MAPKFDPKPTPKAAKEPDTSAVTALEAVADNTLKKYGAGLFAPRDASELERLADQWYFSGLLPESYYPKSSDPADRWKPNWRARGVARATIVMRFGASLGVLPEQAINSIYIVEGRPHPSSALMLSLAISNGLLARDDYALEPTKTACTMRLFIKSRIKPEVVTATYAEYSHLHKKTNWANYPEDMLVARAIGRAMRRYFADVFHGVYAAEEAVDRGERDATVERILSVVNTDASEPEPMPPPEPAPNAEPGEYEALVAQIEGLIEALPAGLTEDDPRAAEILGLASGLTGAEKMRLGAAFRAKVPNARP